jgi:hypothetical protein
MFAAMVTGREDGCGPEAKFFEPKESPGLIEQPAE